MSMNPTMVAVGSGAQQRSREQIASIGSSLIVVLSGSMRPIGSYSSAPISKRTEEGRCIWIFRPAAAVSAA